MKTTNNHTRISRISMVLCSAIVFGSVLYAQPYAGSNANNSDEAYNRLETLMASTEEAVKYVAPSVDDSMKLMKPWKDWNYWQIISKWLSGMRLRQLKQPN